MKRKGLLFWLLALAFSSAMAQTPWQRMTAPVPGPAQAIGGFANGCMIGAQALPLESPDYQVMRQHKRRYFGQPALIAFIQRLTRQAHQQQLGNVLIGDMAMPAGGRFDGGHASHQSGLDVDIWLQLPRQRWTAQQLADPQPIDLVSADGRTVRDSQWQPQIAQLIKLAARDPQVTRIFVNPAIKLRLCRDAGADRTWLRKIRPWFHHRAHMHIRLRCPASSPDCQDQPPPPPGDGCGAELHSWFIPRKPSATPPKKRKPPLPPACQALLDNHRVQ